VHSFLAFELKKSCAAGTAKNANNYELALFAFSAAIRV